MISKEVQRLMDRQSELDRLLGPSRLLREQLGVGALADSLSHLDRSVGSLRHLQIDLGIYKIQPSLSEQIAASSVARLGDPGSLYGVGALAKHVRLFDTPTLGINSSSALETITASHARFDTLYRLPTSLEVGRLAREALRPYTLADTVLVGATRSSAVEVAMQAMRSPWLNAGNELRSLHAFGDLVGIGRGIATLSPFGAKLTKGLRPSLGDWRDPITPRDSWQDRDTRISFYVEQGFDAALTEFSPEGLAEVVEATGLARIEPPESMLPILVENFDSDTEVVGQARLQRAFAKLLRLERAIRPFIVRVMEQAFGEDWPDHRIATEMRDAWVAKRDKAVQSGQPAEPLIHYADFTDYKAIIERSDNWKRVFKTVFGRPEDIRESFQRLFPLRIAAMHARLLKAEDEVLLHVEVHRILCAIQTQPRH